MKDEDKMDKFDGTNYYAWALRMRSVLESKGLWEYVEKHVDLLEDGTQEEKNDQKKKIALAKAKILTYLSTKIVNSLGRNVNDPHEIWMRLENVYLKKKFGNVIEQFFNFLRLKFDPKSEMLDHIVSLSDCADAIRDMSGIEILNTFKF